MRMAPQRFAWRFHPIKENRLQPNALIKENKTFLLGLREIYEYWEPDLLQTEILNCPFIPIAKNKA